MKYTKKLTTFLLLYVAASYVSADCSVKGCSGSVDGIYVAESAVYVRMSGDMNKLNCTLYGNNYLTLRNSHENKNFIFSTLLAAHTSKSDQIFVRISEGSSDCKINYVVSKI